MENNHYLCRVKLKEIDNMSKKTTKLGSVKPCSLLSLYSKENKYIGTCLDTPNNFAVACMLNENIDYGKAYYLHFEDVIRKKNDTDILERISTYKKLEKKLQDEINTHKQTINFV